MRWLTAFVTGFIAAALIVVVNRIDGARAFQTPDSVPQAITGTWTGNAHIAVNWTEQKTLPVRVTIAPDGTVAGTVGDATLRDARLQRNRSALGRTLHVKTDWIVAGSLDGAIIRPEAIQRDSVTLPLNWIDDHFEGGLNTSGSELGGKKSMWLAAQHLRLDREAVK